MQRNYRNSHAVTVWCLRDNGDCQYDSEQLSALYHDTITSVRDTTQTPVVVVCRYINYLNMKYQTVSLVPIPFTYPETPFK